MKHQKYHMATMTNMQVEEYLKEGTTVLVPVGTTELLTQRYNWTK